MDVSFEEFKVLQSIDEAMDDTSMIEIFTSLSEERIKEILGELEKLSLVSLERKGDLWKASNAPEAKDLFALHRDWLGLKRI